MNKNIEDLLQSFPFTQTLNHGQGNAEKRKEGKQRRLGDSWVLLRPSLTGIAKSAKRRTFESGKMRANMKSSKEAR